MKFLLTNLFTFSFLMAFSQEDYTLKINDSVYKISLNKRYEFNVNGKKTVVQMLASDTAIYKDNFLQFQYKRGYSVTKSAIDPNVDQIMVMNAEGNGFIFQVYKTQDPSKLNDFMMGELTKENLNYGYEMKKDTYKRKLRSGQQLEVDRALLTYKDNKIGYEIASIGKKDSGVMIVATYDPTKVDGEGMKLIEMMWKTLSIK